MTNDGKMLTEIEDCGSRNDHERLFKLQCQWWRYPMEVDRLLRRDRFSFVIIIKNKSLFYHNQQYTYVKIVLFEYCKLIRCAAKLQGVGSIGKNT